MVNIDTIARKIVKIVFFIIVVFLIIVYELFYLEELEEIDGWL